MLQAENNQLVSLDALAALISLPSLEVVSFLGNPVTKIIPRYRQCVSDMLRTVAVLDRAPRVPIQVETSLISDHLSLLSTEVGENDVLRRRNTALRRENVQLKELCKTQMDKMRWLKSEVTRLSALTEDLAYEKDKSKRIIITRIDSWRWSEGDTRRTTR